MLLGIQVKKEEIVGQKMKIIKLQGYGLINILNIMPSIG